MTTCNGNLSGGSWRETGVVGVSLYIDAHSLSHDCNEMLWGLGKTTRTQSTSGEERILPSSMVASPIGTQELFFHGR